MHSVVCGVEHVGMCVWWYRFTCASAHGAMHVSACAITKMDLTPYSVSVASLERALSPRLLWVPIRLACCRSVLWCGLCIAEGESWLLHSWCEAARAAP